MNGIERISEGWRIDAKSVVLTHRWQDRQFVGAARRGLPAVRVTSVTLQTLGGGIVEIPFGKERNGVQFDVPGGAIAALAELRYDKEGRA